MDKEIWKQVPFDCNYMVSNYGDIYSIRSKKILKGEITKKGYIRVRLTNNNRMLIHVIVAKTFIPNPQNKPQVNHKDGNKQNNCVDNLEWCTQSENMVHALSNKLRIAPKGKDVYNSKPILQYDLQDNFIKEWDCITDAQKELKLFHIGEVCSGKRKKCGNYKFRYKEVMTRYEI